MYDSTMAHVFDTSRLVPRRLCSISHELAQLVALSAYGDQWGSKPWLTRPGKHTKNDGKSQFLMGKSTISMTIFNSYVCLPKGKEQPVHRIRQQTNKIGTTNEKRKILAIQIGDWTKKETCPECPKIWRDTKVPRLMIYPLVNIQKTMENHNFSWENPL
jgi:hypothetical protein